MDTQSFVEEMLKYQAQLRQTKTCDHCNGNPYSTCGTINIPDNEIQIRTFDGDCIFFTDVKKAFDHLVVNSKEIAKISFDDKLNDQTCYRRRFLNKGNYWSDICIICGDQKISLDIDNLYRSYVH